MKQAVPVRSELSDSTAPTAAKQSDPGEHFKVRLDPMRAVEMMEYGTTSRRWHAFVGAFEIFRSCFGNCLEMIHHLGDVPPRDDLDKALRDLACDALDTLRLAEQALLRGYDNQVIVLVRRVHELASLMQYFINFPAEVKAWTEGKKLRPSDIRKALDTAPIPEAAEPLRMKYDEQSAFVHINRDTIAFRMLGEGNRFTLGCQGNVSYKSAAFMVDDLLTNFGWFLSVFHYAFRNEGTKLGTDYIRFVLNCRKEIGQSISFIRHELRTRADERV